MAFRDTILFLDEGDAAKRTAAIGIAALVAVAFAVAFLLYGRAVHVDVVETLQGSEEAEAAFEASAGTVQPRTIYVHVAGAVQNPGVYELHEGARVDDALKAAGGTWDDADADGMNRARVLADGERIYVPTVDEAAAGVGEGAQGADVGVTGGLVNLNTATAAELETLPGIGEATARKIVVDRESNGPYGSVDDLARVSGIGARKLEALRDLVTL